MKWSLVYFDDQPQNIECFNELLIDNFKTRGCTDATLYANVLEEAKPHLILLDVHMPIFDGYTLYKKICDHPQYNGCPIIFISSDHSDENKILSHQRGAVDFLQRDLSSTEIVTRLVNKVKLYLQMATNLHLGNLNIDLTNMKATAGGKLADLTMLEMRILSHLLRTFPNPVTRMELIERIWGDQSVKPGTINTHLTNLKPKIEAWDYLIKVREENVLIAKKNQ